NGNILGLPPTPSDVNFDGAGPGECLVWHLSYEDGLTGAEVGANAADLQGCYSLSNPISVFRIQPEGGTLDGGPFTFCVSDGVDDMIAAGDITLTGNSGTNSAWVVTDVNGNILGLPPTPSDVNFDGAGPGECLVWHLSYEDGLTGAEVGANAADLQGCYSLSNPISVFRIEVNGGMVMTEDGETEITVTVGDGIDDIIHFDSIDVVGDQFTYVVTDDNNVILAVPGGDQVNFEGAGIGVCRVWGLAYTGNITAMPGDTASLVDLSDGCFDLSDDFITVIREGNLIEPEFEVLTDKTIADVVITPWPNPTSRALNIRIKQEASARNASINIISFSGQVMHRIELDGDAALQQLEVDVTNFPGGIYNILYQSEKVQRSERFIKQ
ncbi:MAG: T9SS type A sorting domain-containing protein, partial [Chitinophagales bacterium]|nr:T9SS type A sorting domain-containing protein [Chitinophagales bacterium]